MNSIRNNINRIENLDGMNWKIMRNTCTIANRNTVSILSCQSRIRRNLHLCLERVDGRSIHKRWQIRTGASEGWRPQRVKIGIALFRQDLVGQTTHSSRCISNFFGGCVVIKLSVRTCCTDGSDKQCITLVTVQYSTRTIENNSIGMLTTKSSIESNRNWMDPLACLTCMGADGNGVRSLIIICGFIS